MRMPTALLAGIRRYRADDGDDLADFQLRTFGPDTRQVDRARDAWLFDRNPWRRGHERDMWICRRDDTIVGQQAAIPFVLRAGGVDHPAAWGIDLMVDDDWRMRGPGPALLDALLTEHPIVGVMNMSHQGYALCRGMGFADLGIIPVYLRPLDLAGATETGGAGETATAGETTTAGETGGAGGLPGAVRRVAPVVGPMLRAADTAAVATLRSAGVRLERVDRFDERVDEVWQAAAPVGDALMARRDAQAVAWAIDDRPDRDRMRRYYLVRRGRALGYVVLRPSSRADTRGVVVVDYLAPPRWVAPMLVAAGVDAREQGAVAMSVKTRNQPADRYLRAAGFVRRARGADHPVRFMVYCRDDELRSQLVERRHWYVTSADCDLEYGMAPTGRADDAGGTSADTGHRHDDAGSQHDDAGGTGAGR